MSKTIIRSLIVALAGVFAMDLHAEIAWTTGSCSPAEWTALANNLLAGETGTISGSIATSYSTNDPNLLTDISVPTTGGKDWIVGFQNTASIKWTFATPKTLESVRVSCGYLADKTYSGFTVSSVEVQSFGSSEWRAVNSTAGQMTTTAQADILSLVLADGSGDPLAETVGAIRVTFGTPPVGYANYCVEIEAVGFAEATGPVLGAFDIAPAKTKARVAGSIVDAGTDATACDVYLSLDGGAATKIAEGVTGSFECQLQGLTAGTTYAYELSVSNNAPTAKGTVRSGEFTTMAADAQTALWTTVDVAPASWAALSGNLLAGATGTTSGNTEYKDYATNDPTLLTDASVPTSGGKDWIVGFGSGSSISWTFAAPKTIERLRISACYLAGNAYTRLAITGVYVKLAGSETWDALDAPPYSDIGGRNTSVILCASLFDSEMGYLSQNVVGLKIAFGNVGALASYCAEIEAVGYAEATGPVISSFDLLPAKTKARVSGAIADPGTDATACDVYLSLNGGAATKIAEGVTGSFDYQLQGLTAGTTYAYELSVSNNAPTAKVTVRNGSFTTLAADAQTASWKQGEYAPADWTALENNILRGLDATEKSGVSFAASQDMTKLTDGSVPNPAAGAETVGFTPNGTIAWAFAKPMTIEKLRISSLWESTLYNGISVNAIHVKYRGSTEWEKLDVPTVQWTGGSQFGQTETLTDAENGFLAQKVVGLKITFGEKKAALANYYAEIEAVGYEEQKGMMLLLR